MVISQVIAATTSTIFLTIIVFYHIGFSNVKYCFSLWFNRNYWTNYNIVEFAAYTSKIIIIVPGLVFGIQIWQLYFLTLITSLALIWASNKKLLPTLVGFNTIWAWLSCMVLSQHLF